MTFQISSSIFLSSVSRKLSLFSIYLFIFISDCPSVQKASMEWPVDRQYCHCYYHVVCVYTYLGIRQSSCPHVCPHVFMHSHSTQMLQILVSSWCLDSHCTCVFPCVIEIMGHLLPEVQVWHCLERSQSWNLFITVTDLLLTMVAQFFAYMDPAT